MQPDLTIVLDIAVEHALGRIVRGFDRLESRGAEYMEKVRCGFLEQISHLRSRAIVVDANAEIDSVQAWIQHAVDRLLAAKK